MVVNLIFNGNKWSKINDVKFLYEVSRAYDLSLSNKIAMEL